MTKYVSYIRVSTKRQGDSGLGLESQRAVIKRYYPDIEREFLEVKSAKNISERPVLSQAIQYCKDNKAILVVAKVDRLTRNVDDGRAILKQLGTGGIKFCDMILDVDIYTLTDHFNRAEREREIISIRTKASLEAKRARGELMGTNLPKCKNNLASYQYKIAGAAVKKNIARTDPENMKSYNLAKSLRTQGLTLAKIADKLNEANVTSTGGKWHIGTVGRLLKRA